MKLRIRHSTRYSYSRPVLLGPHVLRLRPRADGNVTLMRHVLDIHPPAAGTSESLDTEGNLILTSWFTEPVTSMVFRAESVVATRLENPYDYIVLCPEAARVPATYGAEEAGVLRRYLEVSDSARVLVETANRWRDRLGDSTVVFLRNLTEFMASGFRQAHREHGEPLSSSQTLQRQEGACRDLTVLFMDICRILGLAARFVSGYKEDEKSDGTLHLHAWPEIYLPGAGWRGFDPTAGIAVSVQHVALAAGARPQDAAPVSGSYGGEPARTELETVIEIVRL